MSFTTGKEWSMKKKSLGQIFNATVTFCPMWICWKHSKNLAVTGKKHMNYLTTLPWQCATSLSHWVLDTRCQLYPHHGSDTIPAEFSFFPWIMTAIKGTCFSSIKEIQSALTKTLQKVHKSYRVHTIYGRITGQNMQSPKDSSLKSFMCSCKFVQQINLKYNISITFG